MQLVITNLTGRSQQATLLEAGTGANAGQTAPINPQDVAQLETSLEQGQYSLAVADGSVSPATLSVGAPRPPAADSLDEP